MQPHIHVLFSERTNDVLERKGPVDYFKQPQGGGCAKDRWFSQRSHVSAIRAAWCDTVNFTLERAGGEARIHPSSLYKRDIDRQPEPKVGPGQDPAAMAERARIRQTRDDAKEQAQAAAAWEARKALLGITDVRQLSPADFLTASRQRARGTQPGQWAPGAPAPQQQAHARTMRRQRAMQATARRFATELRILTRRQQTIHLPRARGKEPAIGTGLRARLRDEEQAYERDPGRGW